MSVEPTQLLLGGESGSLLGGLLEPADPAEVRKAGGSAGRDFMRQAVGRRAIQDQRAKLYKLLRPPVLPAFLTPPHKDV